MKRLFSIGMIVTAGLLIVEELSAQATTNQTVTVSVGNVYKIAVSGNPGPLSITEGIAGLNQLASVSDNSTTYSITQNVSNTVKISAQLSAALPAGFTLQLQLASSKGTSAGTVDISNGSSVDVVTAIARGADAGQMITYTFSATADAGTLAPTVRTVTLTLTN